MIEAKQFVDSAKRAGFDFWTGVPCSFLTPFINYVSSDRELMWVTAPNEGDAVAVASGAALGDRGAVVIMQNSGLGNAVSPISSLNRIFKIPVLLIITLRGEPGRPDEPQHELMGQVTGQLLTDLQVPWQWFPDRAQDVEAVMLSVARHMETSATPYALVMKKGMVNPFALKESAGFRAPAGQFFDLRDETAELPGRRQVLKALVAATPEPDTVLLASTGFNSRELYAIIDRPNQLYMVGSMGCAAALGLGLGLARPDRKVIVIDGDGGALMRLGNMAMAGAYGGENFFYVLLDNGVHESTGGQATLSAAVDFPAMALACGYKRVYATTRASDAGQLVGEEAPAFMHVRTRSGIPEDLPRPSIKPAMVARRLMAELGVSPAWAAVEGP